MATNKKGFILYADLLHTIEKMPVEKAGELFLHILRYVNDKDPKTNDLIIELTFEPIKQQLKRDLKHWESIREKRSFAGKESAKKRKQDSTSVESVEQTSTNSTVIVNDNVNVNVNDIVINNKINKEEGEINFKGRVKIGNEVFKKPVSRILKEDFTELFETCMMNQLAGTDLNAILAAMDEEYSFYEFRDQNHLFNSLKAIKTKITKVKYIKPVKHSKIEELEKSNESARDLLGLNNTNTNQNDGINN